MFKIKKFNINSVLQTFRQKLGGVLVLKGRKFYAIVALSVVAVAVIGLTTRAAINSNKTTAIAEKAEVKATAEKSSLEEISPIIRKNTQSAVTAALGSASNETSKKLEIITYAVKTGDTLASIAKTYNISSSSIAASNGISETSTLKQGQQLRFPSVKGVLYKIRQGETLWDIASANDIKADDIVSINSLSTPDKLKINQEIVIPGIDKLKPAKAVVVASAPVKKVTAKASTTKAKPRLVASRGGFAKATTANASLKNLIWPVAVRGIITSSYGYRDREFHEGIDIATQAGTALRAAADGIVTDVIYRNTSYGNTVKISLGNGVEVYYAHNQKNLVKVGDVVSQGQVIATLGDTGRSSGPHVEFGIKVNGRAVNPMSYLQ